MEGESRNNKFVYDQLEISDDEIFSYLTSQRQISELYSLTPVGKRSYLIEGLTSYILRISEAHNITIGSLVSKKLGPLFNKHYLSKMFRGTTRKINGNGDVSKEFIRAIEKLTLRDDIELMTFQKWEGFMVPHILRKTKAWCPKCFQEWKDNDQLIYEPLIWSLKHFTSCRKHKIRLVDNCAHCKNNNLFISAKSRIGYCSKCLMWLGNDSNIEFYPEKWESWKVDNIISLLEFVNVSTQTLTAAILSKMITQIKLRFFDGVTLRMSKELGVNYTILLDWQNQRWPVPFEMALKISFHLNIPLVNLMITNNYEERKDQFRSYAREINCNQKRTVLNPNEIQNKLQAFIDSKEESPISLEEVHRRLNVSKNSLYKYAREQAMVISNRYMTYRKRMKQERLITLHNEIKEIMSERYKLDGRIASHRYIRKRLKTTYYADEVSEIRSEVILDSLCSEKSTAE